MIRESYESSLESKRPRLDSTEASGEAESELTLTGSKKPHKHLLFPFIKIRTQIWTDKMWRIAEM